MSKKKNTTEDIEVMEGEVLEDGLLPFNPLMGSIAISPDDEAEQKYELIEKTESLAVLNKQVLEAKQRETELIVDNKKLDAAQKLIEGINLVADKALSKETLSKIIEKEDLTPMDLKFMAESMEKMSNTLKSLMKPSIQDEYGGRKKTKIMAQFRTPDGGTASIGVAIDNDD
ncbi:hypothetical protein [Tissierella pigra]|uniref:Uncharacterized protein n=1 Tax=Tissierella pigra TaxID=2607614 RepID=A0A6N7XWX5_9FIRM|nr:hypothetical protein [Tissierella pigra]MSU01953.1 hypothetical protein [Tissierella pigra]